MLPSPKSWNSNLSDQHLFPAPTAVIKLFKPPSTGDKKHENENLMYKLLMYKVLLKHNYQQNKKQMKSEQN